MPRADDACLTALPRRGTPGSAARTGDSAVATDEVRVSVPAVPRSRCAVKSRRAQPDAANSRDSSVPRVSPASTRHACFRL
jgi:hypothetical protein